MIKLYPELYSELTQTFYSESDDSSGGTSSCEPSYTATEGITQTITSPYYPSEYPNSHDACTSVISAGAGQQVQLTFTDFELESTSCTGSCYDYVEVKLSIIEHIFRTSYMSNLWVMAYGMTV